MLGFVDGEIMGFSLGQEQICDEETALHTLGRAITDQPWHPNDQRGKALAVKLHHATPHDNRPVDRGWFALLKTLQNVCAG